MSFNVLLVLVLDVWQKKFLVIFAAARFFYFFICLQRVNVRSVLLIPPTVVLCCCTLVVLSFFSCLAFLYLGFWGWPGRRGGGVLRVPIFFFRCQLLVLVFMIFCEIL